MKTLIKQHYSKILKDIESEGLYKKERIIKGPQQANIEVKGRKTVLNMCANNYLGLANNPEIIKAAKESYGAMVYLL